MSKTIYTDFETEEIIKKVRDKEPNFNLSDFVRLALIEKSGHKTQLDEVTINKNILDSKNSLVKAQSDISFWESRLQDFLVQQEVNRREEAERKVIEEKRNALKEQARINIMKIFKEEMGREMSEFEYEEYSKLDKSNIWAFCDRLKQAGEQK